MSGVGEVIAIVSCVAGLIEALDAGHRIVKQIKERRRAHRAAGALPPSEELEKTIEDGKNNIQKLVEKGNRRFGPDFEKGDETAQIAIMRITIQIQNALLNRLTQARADDGVIDFEECIDLSDQGCMEALVALQQLYQRKLEKSMPKKPDAIIDEENRTEAESPTSAAVQRVNTAPPTLLPSRALPAADSQPRKNTIDEDKSPSPLSERSVPEPYPWFRKNDNERKAKAKPLTQRFRTAPADIPKPSRKSSTTTVDQCYTSNKDSRVSLSSHTSSHPDSPQANGRSDRPQSWENGMSRASTLQMTSSPKSVSRTSSTEIAKYGGTCKYAFFMRENGSKGNLIPQCVGTYTQNWILRCRSTKCEFYREISKDRKGPRDQVDESVYESHGIQYRWIFLAKSHCQQNMMHLNWLYVCLICQLLDNDPVQYEGPAKLFAHIASHHEEQVGGVPLGGPLTFSNHGIRVQEHFDLRMPEQRRILREPSRTEADCVAAELQAKLKVVEADRTSNVSSLSSIQTRESSSSDYTDPYANPWAEHKPSSCT